MTGMLIMMYLNMSGKRLRSTKDIADACNVSANTARKWLYRLRNEGKVYSKTHYYGQGLAMLLWQVPDAEKQFGNKL